MASVHQVGKKGTWYAMWRDATGKLHQRSTGLAGTKHRKAAQEWAEETERASRLAPELRTVERFQRVITEMHRRWTGQSLTRATLRTHCAAWLEIRKGELADKSYPAYVAATDSFTESMTALGRGDVPLAEVSRQDLIRWRDERRKDVNGATVNKNLKILRTMFRQAKEDHLIPENPCDGVKAVKVRANEKHQPAPFTEQQVRDVLAECDDEWLSMVIHGYYTGQRLSDLAVMKASDVDPVQQQVRFRTGKTGKLVLVEMTEEYLSWYLSRSVGDSPQAFLHPKCAATIVETNRSGTLSNRFSRILERAGLRDHRKHRKQKDGRSKRRQREDYSFHGLRHSLVTDLAKNGVARSIVQDMVGHSSAAVNASYTHIDSATKRQAMSMLPDVTQKADVTQLSFMKDLDRQRKSSKA